MVEHRSGAPNLAGLLKRRGPLPDVQLVKLFITVLEDLELNHSQAQLHLDVKPEKIVRGVGGKYKLTDYGMSRLGTPRYMAPERAQKKRPDARSDIYSLGVVMFEAATGRPPFTGELNYELLDAHVNKPPPLPRSIRQEISIEVQRVIQTAMAKDPDARFQTAAEFKSALTGIHAELVKQTLDGSLPQTSTASARSGIPASGPVDGQVLEDTKTLAGVMSGRRPARGAKVGAPAGPQPSAGAAPKRGPRVPRRKRKASPVVWIIPLGLVLVAAVVFAVTRAGKRVPGLLGLTEEEARLKTTRAGLPFVLDGERDDTMPRGVVVYQSLLAGAKFGDDDSLRVVVSSGLVTIPDVAGMKAGEARLRLAEFLLAIEKVDSVYSNEYPVGVVVATTPAAGARVPPRTGVAVGIASGQATCPDCGRRREPNARFCISCGYDFSE